MWLVVGLGNPGPEYEETRHNIGFLTVDALMVRNRVSAPLRPKFGADVGEAQLGGARVLFCKPMEFMNVSGQAVARVARFWKIAPAETVVVHDDLDLPFGRLKLGAGGGHGGHNGLRSLITDWGTADFLRVRAGIGRPAPGRQSPADYVLATFSKAEQKDLPDICARAAEAVETILKAGIGAAMNQFNGKTAEAAAKSSKGD